MAKITTGLKDIEKQITFFLSEQCRNQQLDIQTQSAERLIREGWVKKRVENLFKENNYSTKDMDDFFKEHCKDIIISELGELSLEFPQENNVTLGDLINSIKFQFVIELCNVKISNILKILKC